jgi:hypothetical protein
MPRSAPNAVAYRVLGVIVSAEIFLGSGGLDTDQYYCTGQ